MCGWSLNITEKGISKDKVQVQNTNQDPTGEVFEFRLLMIPSYLGQKELELMGFLSHGDIFNPTSFFRIHALGSFCAVSKNCFFLLGLLRLTFISIYES